MERLKKSKIFLFYFMFMFIVLVVFFTCIKPLTLYDADDWYYVSQIRLPIPNVLAWNPGKVLPEVLMPICGFFSAYVVYPILGDYVYSITVVNAIVVAAFITLYFYFIFKLILVYIKFSANVALLAISIIFTLHFLCLINCLSNNLWLFLCIDITCYYNYLIPSIINIILVLWVLTSNKIDVYFKFVKTTKYKNILLVLLLYFAIFSNLYSNFILPLFALFIIIKDVLKLKKQKISISVKQWIKKNNILLLIMIMFIFMGLIESCGGRAENLHRDQNIITLLIKGFVIFFEYSLNHFLILFIVFWISILIFLYIQNRKNYIFSDSINIILLYCIFMIFLSYIYVIFLSAFTGLEKLQRIQTYFPMLSFSLIFIIIVLFTSLKVKIINNILILLLAHLLVLIPVCIIGLNNRFMSNPNYVDVDERVCEAVDNDIISSIKNICSDKDNNNSVDVPVGCEDIENWPHSKVFGDKMAKTLYLHGIVYENIKVDVHPNYDVNIKYGIPLLKNPKIQ